MRRRYLSPDVARAIAVQIADATFLARRTALWGTGSTAVASDSTHIRAYDQNIFTEWHSRYGGRGVLIYGHVERKSMVVHSQLISCTASEVAAMIEGAIRHGTTMQVDGNYVDSHGQSEIGFGITRLLGFDLLPRIKRINHVKLYRPVAGEFDVPHDGPPRSHATGAGSGRPRPTWRPGSPVADPRGSGSRGSEVPTGAGIWR